MHPDKMEDTTFEKVCAVSMALKEGKALKEQDIIHTIPGDQRHKIRHSSCVWTMQAQHGIPGYILSTQQGKLQIHSQYLIG